MLHQTVRMLKWLSVCVELCLPSALY